MALLDTIKSQLQQPELGSAAGTGGQTQTVRELLRAKTGKVTAPTTGPRQSSLREKMAEAQTRQGQEQLQQTGEIQAAQVEQREADIAQREEQQGLQFQENLKNAQADFQRRSDDLLQQFERGQKTLESQQDLADMEQLGFQLRLQNDQYINQLQDVGRRSRLDNELEFKKQIAQNVFQDQQDLLNNELVFNQIVAADDRTFAEELANMDINYAMQVAENAAKAASSRQVAQGLGSTISGGIQAYGVFNSMSGASPGASGEANPGGAK